MVPLAEAPKFGHPNHLYPLAGMRRQGPAQRRDAIRGPSTTKQAQLPHLCRPRQSNGGHPPCHWPNSSRSLSLSPLTLPHSSVGGSLIVARRGGRQLIVQESCSNSHHRHSLAQSSPDPNSLLSRPERDAPSGEPFFFVPAGSLTSSELATMMEGC